MRYFRVREVYHNKADPFVFPLRDARDAITRAVTNPMSAEPVQVTDDGEGDSKDIDKPAAGGHVAGARADQNATAPLEQGGDLAAQALTSDDGAMNSEATPMIPDWWQQVVAVSNDIEFSYAGVNPCAG